MSYSNSKLVTYSKISPNKTSPRNHKIDTITIHCFVGQVTAESGCNVSHFVNSGGASCNYVVGYDGSIGLVVDECDRSWCSSSSVNDNRAITIEVASDNYSPYAVTGKAYEALIKLVADICSRNKIEKLVWSNNKEDRINHLNGVNMTVHRDYANKSCPGEYLYSRMGDIANKVNNLLINEEELGMTKKEFIDSLTASEAYEIYLKAMEGASKPKIINSTDWRKAGLDWAKNNGIMVGDETGNQMPDKAVTRGELATMLKSVYNLIMSKVK